MLKITSLVFVLLLGIAGGIFYYHSGTGSPTKKEQLHWDSCDSTNSLYLYKDKAIDLETLQWIVIDVLPKYTFKSCSPYKSAFADEGNPFNTLPCQLIDDRNPGKQAGSMELKDTNLSFTILKTNTRYAFTLPQNHSDNSCIAILKDHKVIVATWHSIATGSALYCFDIDKRSLVWQADVTQLMVPHSKYYNRVFLSIYKNKVIMEGAEAGGSYLQVFDLSTGKKLLEQIR